MRQLIFEKNRLFEEQEPGALDAMTKINGQLDEFMGKAVEDLGRPSTFLGNVQQSILECLQIERKAFQTLGSII